MDIAIIIYSDAPETAWNAFRLGTFMQQQGDSVEVFLLGKGVEADILDTSRFNVTEWMEEFYNAGGKIWACGTCMDIHKKEPLKYWETAKLDDLDNLIKKSEKVITF